MADISAAAVMSLREKTGLPMMECKKALLESGGNTEQAVEWLRKQGIKTQAMRADRETSTGRLAVYSDLAKGVAAMIELKCESAPVAVSQDFKDLANDMAKQLALGPGAGSASELLAQKSLAVPMPTTTAPKPLWLSLLARLLQTMLLRSRKTLPCMLSPPIPKP